MDKTYFASRTELLAWMNEVLQINYDKLDQASNGAAFCQIIDVIFPGKVPLHRVNFKAKLEYEFEKNYKILQDSFTKLGIQKAVDVQKLQKGKFQDVLELCQWIKGYYSQNVGTGARAGYDPVARREGKPTSASLSDLRSEGMSGSQEVANEKKGSPRMRSPARGAAASSGSLHGKSNELEEQLNTLSTQASELRETMDGIERERNFYFDKLRKIEIICQAHEEDPIVKQILKILYAAEGEFVQSEPS
ncbi:MAG: putative Microtubule-associated protein RP/EB family member 1 [Streblomastix strix]|uniref:Putative Microtubule-associated protein RP/EB family member 1 n=1 Tax=Streblomastix strix TaxID=222440 RepID=A0A5J4VSR1_9EUKA|nr:MAG: putative Microtubule-associated protein RP/EB family member 1 [Streblomastix strix]